jgi:hypothetical protein
VTRVVVLRTFTSSCVPIFSPLRRLGHEVSEITYDLRGVDFGALPARVAELRPDWVLLMGCADDQPTALVPTVDVLSDIGRVFPLVHLCCDGSEPVWWPQLERYRDSGAFALQINVDGVRVGPIAEDGITCLCPIDPASLPDPPRPHAERTVRLGFCGSSGGDHPRTRALESIMDVLTIRPRDHDSPAGYLDFLSSCRCAWNHAATGTGDRSHVKARVIEAALAGALVLETAGSPTRRWFAPGEDYLEYNSADEVREHLAWADVRPEEAEAMALRMRRKIVESHSPALLWDEVIRKIT